MGNLTSVLTQSRVVRWLANRSEWVMGDIATMSVDDFRLGYRDVVTVNHNDQAINGSSFSLQQLYFPKSDLRHVNFQHS